MTLRRILILLIFALVGYGALAYLFTRVHPAARFDQQIDRARAIELARAETARQGLDTASWSVTVDSELQRNSDYYLFRDPNQTVAPFLSATVINVTLRNVVEKREFEISLAHNGRVISWSRSEPKPKDPPPPIPAAEPKSRAEAAFATLAGPLRSRFEFRSESESSPGAKQYSWELNLPDEPRLKLSAEAKVDNGVVTDASLRPTFSPQYLDSIRKQRLLLNGMTVVYPIVLLLGLLVGLIYYFLNIVHKEIRHRSTLILFGAILLLIAFWIFTGGVFDSIYYDISGTPQLQRYNLGFLVAAFVVSLLSMVFALPFFILWGAGYPFASRLKPNPLATLEAVLQGHPQSRLVGGSVLTGMALGFLLPVFPMLIAWSGLFGNTQARTPEMLAEILTTRTHLMSLPTEPAIISFYIFFTLYVFLVPLFSQLLRRPFLVRCVAVVIGIASLAGSGFFQTSFLWAVVLAGFSMLLLDRLTYRVDIVAALVALLAGDFALKVCALVAQPAATIHSAGLRGWILLGGLGVLAAYVALRGKVLAGEEVHPVWTTDEQRINRVDRDRLKAEFDVARRAQEQMLPSNPPQLPGFEIAAVCKPAREVGGDLYDFIELPDDRLGIVVADVSGKGVPASLYMTLTKGLLASIAEVTSDPGQILREVNRHLYVACGKKMFVTLLLGVLDPVSRSFSYARAGHNPPVWRQRASQSTSLLHARGIGLGLNRGDVFDRTLLVETIQLRSEDKLLLYSDGITEAMNDQRLEYGEGRLMQAAERADGLDARATRDAILDDVTAFLGKTLPQDDQTLVVVQVN